MRELVTIRLIDTLNPIPDAQNIEQAIIGGWSVVVKKGEFSVGSQCLFFEIDSFLPADNTAFDFLGKPIIYNGNYGYRLRTIKLRKTLSQGLALPLSYFNNLDTNKDLADQLNVTKWEAPISTSIRGDAKGNFPSFIPKTNQERIQNLSHFFKLHKHTVFEESLKLDGSSMTVYKITRKQTRFERILNTIYKLIRIPYSTPTTFNVCSRNIELKYNKSNIFWAAAMEHNLEKLLPTGFALQGELIAPSIQKNWEKVTSPEYHIFDVYDIETQRYLTPFERKWFLLEHNMEHLSIPIVEEEIAIFEECQTFSSLQERVTGQSINKNTISEGRVYKSVNGKTTFKCVSNKYLVKSGT